MDYREWVGGPWIITDLEGGGGALDEGDSLTFALEPSDSSKLRISGFSCSHGGRHHGAPLVGVVCRGVGNMAEGETNGARTPFAITASTLDEKIRLTSHPREPLHPTEPVNHTTGGVCWTAEDGRS